MVAAYFVREHMIKLTETREIQHGTPSAGSRRAMAGG
jgi:hypothetical protein